MKLYHFPSPNPQKVTFALKELGLNCEIVSLDLAKGEQRQPDFLALNPFGRVPVLTDGDLTLTESHAILAISETRPEDCGRPRQPSGRTRCNGYSCCRSTSCRRRGRSRCGSGRRSWASPWTKRSSRRASRPCSRSSASSTGGSRQNAGCSALISPWWTAPIARC